MDINSGIQAAALDQHSKQVGDAVTTKMMDKTMDIQASSAAQLLEGVEENSDAVRENLPDNVGKNVNTSV
ncbi:YjfB family protein [Thiohalospira sp.]|uniref:YjfB family protein n=1 Tax=Thiohalospira sp. TaxID=3080549 RepID=UPI00397ED509